MTAWDGMERRKPVLAYQQEVLTKLESLSTSLTKVVKFIEGNGNPEHGAIIRLDRLEQTGARERFVWLSITGLALKTFWDVLTTRR